MTIIFLICIIIKEKWVFTVQFITQAGCSFLEIKGMKFSRGKLEPLSKLMTSVMRIAETIGFFLSRALNECKPKAQHEFSANHTCALNESELKAKYEFSAAGRVEILNECKPKAQHEFSAAGRVAGRVEKGENDVNITCTDFFSRTIDGGHLSEDPASTNHWNAVYRHFTWTVCLKLAGSVDFVNFIGAAADCTNHYSD